MEKIITWCGKVWCGVVPSAECHLTGEDYGVRCMIPDAAVDIYPVQSQYLNGKYVYLRTK